MLAELDRLEERITQAAETIRLLRGRLQEAEEGRREVEKERDRYLQERSELAERISRLVERVDALRMEL